jgi:REP element-mobilizing transposase RayT
VRGWGCNSSGLLGQPVILWTRKGLKRVYCVKWEKERWQAPQPLSSDSLELDGFRPVDPWKSPERSESRRHLPHLHAPESTYFVTFRCRKCLFLSDQAKEIVMSTICHWDGIRIDLDAVVVMPDHVHFICRILGGLSLSTVLHSIKGYSARLINTLLARKGPFWLDESFDHVIRQEHEWEEKIGYIRDNPAKRGLVADARDYRWLWIKE